MIPLRIVVRTNTDWSGMTMQKFLAQKDPQKPTEFIRLSKKVLPVWEKATGKNFFQYRDEVKKACEAKLRETGIPVTIGIENVDWDSEDEALIPIDDDDIVLPSVSSIGERFTDDINVIMWNRITNFLGKERLEQVSCVGQLDTCNWAIRKSFLKTFTMPERVTVLARHWFAAGVINRKFGKPEAIDLIGKALEMLHPMANGIHLDHPSVIGIQETHSIYYLHSASISFLTYKNKDASEKYLKSLPLHPLVA